MPGLTPRDMNGYGDYDRRPPGGGYGVNAPNGFDDYGREDPYHRHDLRDDPYGRTEDLYAKATRNGNRFGGDYFGGDQTSLADFHSNEPIYELDHLATYTAGTRYGVISVEDGLLRLRKMEHTTGIWTMRCILTIERRFLVVLDKSTGEELERFPMNCVTEPTAVFKNDRREVYNNLVLFTVVEDPRKRSGQGDLHIFQSIKVPSQDIVDEILAAKAGRQRISAGPRIPPPPAQAAPEPPRGGRDMYNFSEMQGYVRHIENGQFMGGPTRRTGHHIPFIQERDDSGQNEVLEKDVQLLNHCFDDIERFVARLQQAAEAYKELERRKRERGGNRAKKRQSGDGMLSHRARPPPAGDFVDIFQKFKLSFNLLAKLKAHIHDPNAPELVHFLFTPLSLIYEASRDPFHGNRDLADQAVSPVLTHDAKQLLLNCLTSKEIKLWQDLGKHWVTSKDEWRGYIPAYNPTFYDGWRPSPSVIEDGQVPLEAAVMTHHNQVVHRVQHEPEPRMSERERVPPAFQDDDRPYQRQIVYDRRPSPRPITPPPPMHHNESVGGYAESLDLPIERESRPVRHDPPPPMSRPTGGARAEENAVYLEELLKNRSQVYEALHERQGKNQKELTVEKGDILQVVDSSRKWWKVRNYKGETGYTPYTILKEIKNDGYSQESARDRNSGAYNSYLPNDHPPTPPMPPPPAPQLQEGGRRPKRGDFKYF